MTDLISTDSSALMFSLDHWTDPVVCSRITSSKPVAHWGDESQQLTLHEELVLSSCSSGCPYCIWKQADWLHLSRVHSPGHVVTCEFWPLTSSHFIRIRSSWCTSSPPCCLRGTLGVQWVRESNYWLLRQEELITDSEEYSDKHLQTYISLKPAIRHQQEVTTR